MLNSIHTEKLPLLLAFWAELSMKGPRFDSFGQTLFLPFCTWRNLSTWQDYVLTLLYLAGPSLTAVLVQDLVLTFLYLSGPSQDSNHKCSSGRKPAGDERR